MIIGGLAMDGLVMNEGITVDEFLDQMLDAKDQQKRDVVGTINGVSVSTEGCTTKLQLRNKVASTMHDYIKGDKNEQPTKRQQDEMTIMLDESIVPKAEWDDPNDVLAWINESSKNLNDPEFARTVYKDGKTPAEVMIDMLQSHGYGEIHENQSETEREISAKMSDLENYGFLASDFFGDEAVDLSQSLSTNETSMETSSEATDSSYIPFDDIVSQDDDYRFLSGDGKEFDDEFAEDEFDDEYDDSESIIPSFTEQPDLSTLSETSPVEIGDEVEQTSELSQGEVEDEFFSTRPKDGVVEPTEEEVEEETDEFFQTKLKDDETQLTEETDEFFQTKQKDDAEEEFFREKSKSNSSENESEANEFFQEKPKDEDIAELEAFQAKYGPTANMKEMKIVKHVEQELVELKERRQELKAELAEIHEKLTKPSQVVSGSIIANIENKNNSDLAIHEAREKIRLSTATTRNNDAVPAFNKAVETHHVIDIVRTSNAIEALGTEHLLSASLTHALEEMTKTYYGKSVDQLKEDLMEGSKALAEANHLLATNPDGNVYEEQIASVREAVNNVTTDRSKEKIMNAVIQVKNLEEGNPYTPTIMNALDKISNLYYGKTAEQIKNQILDCSKTCNEAKAEIERTRKRAIENSETVTEVEFTLKLIEETLNRAIMDHSKENILVAARFVQDLSPKEPSRDVITKALNQLAVTHLNMNLTELRWQDARSSIEEAQKITDINDQEVIQRFNQATKTYTKADIIVALNKAKEVGNSKLVSALNKMAIAYYGVDAEALTMQFRNYSKALNDVQSLLSSNEIPADAKENDVMPLFHQAVQSKSEEDIMNALDAANRLPSYHPLKKPILDALNAQLVLVTREEPMTYEEPVVVNDNKKELQKRATELLKEYQQVDSDIKKRQNDLSQYAKNKQKEKEKLQEPPARVINETTNTNPHLFKKACKYAKAILKEMSLKKVAKVTAAAIGIGALAYVAPIPLAVGYAGYKLLRDPEKAKKKKEEKQKAKEERKRRFQEALEQEDEEELTSPTFVEKPKDEPLEQDESEQWSVPVEQSVEQDNQEEIEFYKAQEDEWVRLNSQAELIQEAIDGSPLGVSVNQGPIEEYSNEDIMNYLHNGELAHSEEVQEGYENVGEKRGR